MNQAPLANLQGVQAALHTARTGQGDTDSFVAALTALRRLREELSGWEPELITAARASGASWTTLAPALGVASRQAAERRYLRLQPSSTGETTGEARVDAQRTRRAGDRAVSDWARQNSATLRSLAGQITALPHHNPTARQHATELAEALGNDDPATLLTPLAATQPHLGDQHKLLAQQLGAVAEHADQARRDATRHRNHHP